jgi:L-methionine (R)-S-oxide reductase
MAESLVIAGQNASKKERYETLVPQLRALTESESDLVANLSNLMAGLKESMGFFWVGVYFVRENELVLGPFQGPVACSRIGFGKGVCGACWEKEEAIIVPDVDQFPGHIACSSLSRSEIVVPVKKDGKVVMILDVDSEHLSFFDETDRVYLEQIATLISGLF